MVSTLAKVYESTVRAQETDANVYSDIIFHMFYSQHKPVLRITQRGRWNYPYFVVEALRTQVAFPKLVNCQEVKFGYEPRCSDFKA